MFAIFVLGMALLAVLSGAFSYVLTIFDIVVISTASFLVYYFILGKRKVFLWSLFIGIIVLAGSSIYLYRNELLASTVNTMLNYLKPYYYSIKVPDYYIGKLHQFSLILAIGILLYRLIVMFYNSKRLKFLPPIVGILFITGAFFAGSFSSKADRYAFIMFVLASFIYYFELYYIQTQYSEGVRRRYSFYILATSMAIIVLIFSSVINNTYSNPFMKRIKVAVVSPEANDSEVQDFDIDQLELIYPVSDEYTVSSNFEHRGIELFKVETDKLKYYKGQTFNEFVDGKWTNTKTEKVISSSVIEPVLSGSDTLNEDLFYTEEVQVIYSNIFTDSIVTGPFTKGISFADEVAEVSAYEDGMYKTDDMVGKNFTYTLSIAIPKYRTQALIKYLGELDEDDKDLSEYLNLPEAYGDLALLSENLTKDVDTDIEKAIILERYLKTEFKYNENPEYRPNEDMINEFLFETREGFCQQFATTMALMLRSINIPSRFVTGYSMSASELDIDDIPEEILYMDRRNFETYKRVYDSNAHTWVEIYIPSFGWIQFEPTPGQNVVQFSDPVEFDYDPDFGNQPSVFNTMINHDYFGIILSGIILLIIVSTILLFIRRGVVLKKNIRRRLITNYKLILIYLKAIKLDKESYETLREYSKRLDKRLTNVQQEFKDVVPILEKAFYNDIEPSLLEVENIESFLNEVKYCVRRMVVPITYRRLRFIEVVLLHK